VINLKNSATAGTYESNDCIVTVKKSEGITIEIDSVVKEQFGKQIEKVALETLSSLNISNIHVYIKDKGALDYTIIARIKTAIKRLGV
jgi:citrate lyase subunit gamma (acyl carrier protein)